MTICNLSSFKFALAEPKFRNREAGCETLEPWRFNALHGQKELCRVCGVEGSSMNQIKFKFNQSDHSGSVESLVWMSQVYYSLFKTYHQVLMAQDDWTTGHFRAMGWA